MSETDEQKQIQRWLEGVKRYANRKGYDVAVSAKKLLEMPAAKPVEKVAAAASVHAVYGPTSMKRTTTKGGFPATVTVGTKDMGMRKHAAFIDELEKIAMTVGGAGKRFANYFEKSLADSPANARIGAQNFKAAFEKGVGDLSAKTSDPTIRSSARNAISMMRKVAPKGQKVSPMKWMFEI